MPTQGTWIAIIDDDMSTRHALARILRANFWSALVFGSWEELRPALNISRPACVLLDICLPGSTGFEIQTLLHRHAPGTPVIFLTANDDPEVEIRAKARALFLRKPCGEATLLASLCTAVANVKPNEPAYPLIDCDAVEVAHEITPDRKISDVSFSALLPLTAN